MANESVSVSGPVHVVSDSPARVAFELMRFISGDEHKPDDPKEVHKYWLTLYRQCHKAANGHMLENGLKED